MKGKEPPMCVTCDKQKPWNMFYFLVLILLRYERDILQLSHWILFKDTPLDNIFNFLKEMNSFGKIWTFRSFLVLFKSV